MGFTHKSDDQQLWNCKSNVLFRFLCPKVWENFSTTSVEGVRYCKICKENVHLCTTPEEFYQQAQSGNCVAIQPCMGREKLTMLGRPNPTHVNMAGHFWAVVDDLNLQGKVLALLADAAKTDATILFIGSFKSGLLNVSQSSEFTELNMLGIQELTRVLIDSLRENGLKIGDQTARHILKNVGLSQGGSCEVTAIGMDPGVLKKSQVSMEDVELPLGPIFVSLANEIKQNSQAILKPVLLIGVGAQISGLAEWLSSELGTVVTVPTENAGRLESRLFQLQRDSLCQL